MTRVCLVILATAAICQSETRTVCDLLASALGLNGKPVAVRGIWMTTHPGAARHSIPLALLETLRLADSNW
jgi:hypothetical protein